MKIVPHPSYHDLKRFLPEGAEHQLAAELGLSVNTVRVALKACKPSHPVVQRALALAEECGAVAAARALARLAKKPRARTTRPR